LRKIVVGASSFDMDGEAAALIREEGYDLAPNPFGRKLTEDETIGHLNGAAGLLAGLEPLSERVFAASPSLRALARVGIGMDNVDTTAAARHGISVSNTPDAPTYAVAEMTLAALLAMARGLVPANADMHLGIWKKHMGFSLWDASVLLLGYGRIARKLEELLQGFQCHILIWDPQYPELAAGTLREILQNVKVVSLHASGNACVLGKDELDAMQDGSILLNSARGSLVDEDALLDGLQTGKPAWYWGDVFTDEPYRGKLTRCGNALLTPHISTYTGACRREMELQAARNLVRDLK
jgi:D-3-phosphoglycerate dehydrogenase